MRYSGPKLGWRYEFARDFVSLGSWVFFFLVIVRALIKPYRPFADQMIIAGLILLVIYFAFKHNNYVSKALPLTIFTSLFYESRLFTGFAILACLGVILSSYYINGSLKKIFLGLLFGILAVIVGYFGAFLFN